MRIAFVVERFPSLSETFVLGQIAWLIDSGHDVRIFSQKPTTDPVMHPDVHRLDLVGRTRYARSFAGGYHTRQLQLGTFLLRQVARGKVPAGQLLRGYERSGMRALPAWTYPRGEGLFDAIVAHFGPNGVHAMEMRRAGVLRGPLVTVFHGYDMNPVKHSVRRGYDRLFQEGDLFLAVSQYFRRRLVEWGAPAERVAVHHMGVDPDRFDFIARSPALGPLRLVSVARLVPKKGLEFAVRAAALMGDRVQYTIIGDGPERARLQALIRRLGAEENIVLAGWKTQDQVAGLLGEAHAMLAPSVTTRDGEEEGIPVALMEAMASGLPVISTRHSGIPELIEDDVSGYLVPERDADQLATRLLWLTKQATRGAEMGRAGRRRIEEHFNTGKLYPQFMELLQRSSRHRAQILAPINQYATS